MNIMDPMAIGIRKQYTVVSQPYLGDDKFGEANVCFCNRNELIVLVNQLDQDNAFIRVYDGQMILSVKEVLEWQLE